jgi:RHS repeat-associated protein
MQRVQKTGGSNATEIVYFRGHPVALLNPSSGAWTDLIWAGDSLLTELGQSTTYRLLDHEGSLALATDGSGNVLGANVLTPYGQNMNEQLSDAYTWAGLFQDTEYSGHAARYRNYSGRAARWLTPDPYNGSYDVYNPQSFNRYMYVNGNPLGDVDPSGLAGAGVLTGIGGSPCKTINGTGGSSSFSGISIPVGGGFSINPCDPLASLASIGVVAAINGIWGSGTVTLSEFTPYVGAAITVLCSAVPDLHSNQALCGGKGLTSLIPGNWGTAAGDIIAVAGAYFCATGGPTNPGCIAFAIYTLTNDILSWLGVFDGPQFTGSLLPRPSDLGGLGTAPIGIPNQNLSTSDILGQRSGKQVPSPGMFLDGAPGSIQ